MKRGLLLFIFILVSHSLVAREVHNINRGWKFFSNSAVSSDGALTVNLPHMWNNDALSGKRDYFRGIGNYLKSIKVPNNWQNKRVFIRFYGANSLANFLVNGKHVGEHRGGYTKFTYDITDCLKYGEANTFWVIVNNSPQMDILPTAGDQNSYGGLSRNVEIIVTDPTVISLTDYSSDGVSVVQNRVSEEMVEGVVNVMVDSHLGCNVTAEVTISKNDSMVVFTQSTGSYIGADEEPKMLTIPYTIQDPILWNGVINPYLYSVNVKLFRDDTLVDSLELQTGFRYFSIDKNRGFMLNGSPYRLNGVVAHQDRVMVGPAISTYQVMEDFTLMQEMGATAVRVANVPHHADFYKLCDRFGMIVWSDIPLIGAAFLTDKAFLDTPSFKNNGIQQTKEIVKQHFNHPSIIFWGIFSDLSLRGDDPLNYIKELNTIVKTEDAGRYTAATSSEDGEINFVTDVIVWNHHLGWKEGWPDDIIVWLEQLKKEWSNLNSGISYGAGASIHHQEDSLYRPNYMDSWHPERWQTYFHESYYKNTQNNPQLFGTFVSNMFDYGATGRTWGEANGINDLGLVTFDRRYKKDAFYLYKANWNKNKPFVYIAERRWNQRNNSNQDIKIYSNCREVELFVNGVSMGMKSGDNGIFRWSDILFKDGISRVEANAVTAKDDMFLEILNIKPMGISIE